MSEVSKVLEKAISDVGLWSWWDARLPHNFIVEFAGVQLWSDPLSPDSAPPGQVAIQFGGLKLVEFLTGAERPDDLPLDWPDKIQSNELPPFTVDHDSFTITSCEDLAGIASRASETRVLVGEGKALQNVSSTDAFLGFWAGPVGLIVIAEALRPVMHDGPQTPESIIDRNKKWWEYWREYWSRKASPNPMPKDYACEVTIPVDEFNKMPEEFFKNLGK